jgi:hypothetical protein
VRDLSRCGYTDDGHAPSSQAAPGRLPGRPAACRSRPHIYSFLLVRVPRPVPRVYWPLVLGLRQAQRGRPTALDVGAEPWPPAESTVSMARRRGSQLASRPGPGTG